MKDSKEYSMDEAKGREGGRGGEEECIKGEKREERREKRQEKEGKREGGREEVRAQ